MKVIVDRDTCIGCELCVGVCLNIFKSIRFSERSMIMNIFKFAIDMELDGLKYYMEQAEVNKNNMLYPVCLLMAEEEKDHAKILTDKMNNIDFQLMDSNTSSNAKNIFEGIGAIKNPIKEIPSQLDFYRIASKMEKKSIDLYTDLSSKAAEVKDKELFDYLIIQETQHLQFLNELENLLRKSKEWVEFAEFGVREEY